MSGERVERRAAAKRFPANHYFLQIPLPIAACDRITRLERMVWAAIYSQVTSHAGTSTHLSNGQIALRVGCSKPRASASVARLLEVGLLEVVKRGVRSDRREHGTRRIRICWPDWLIEGVDDRFVLRSAYDGGVDLDDENADESADDERGVTDPVIGGVTDPVTGGYRSGNEGLPDGEGSKNLRKGRRDSSEGADPNEGSANEAVEVEEPNLDGDAPTTAADLVAEKEARAMKRPRKKVARRRPVPDDEDLLRTPSRREVFRRWKGKEPSRWSARDVVGYFAARHVELRGEEAKELFATLDHLIKRQCSNVRKFIDRWLGGDPEKAKAVVDDIFAGAVVRGMPVRLGYFFTPANAGAVERLSEPVKVGRETLAERNDRAAKATDWDARAREREEERKRKREEERKRKREAV